MAKPDDRSDNVERLVEMVQNTIDNLEAAEVYLSEFGAEINEADRQSIIQKNNNRRESIEKFRSEIKDEARAREE